jgi:predicted RNA-binding protein (virulence factor B family)
MAAPVTDLDSLLGRNARLPIRRFASAGAFLAVDAGDPAPDAVTLLLPAAEVPTGARAGDLVGVFVHLDSEERPVATTRVPKLALGEVAFLTVTARTEIGAFVDWGLGKELLVPFAEQSKELSVGERQPIGLYLDRSRRLAGTMYVTDLFGDRRRVDRDEWIEGEAWRNDPDIGLFVILERRFVGLVPASEPHALHRGQAARFRVAETLPDGKLVLSLRHHAYQELASDAGNILAVLTGPRPPQVGDRSDPEVIRALFGLSKKAFKRAVGHLLKNGAVTIDQAGLVVARHAPPTK